eukprot:01942.XXX_10298_10408_1 [CDS] Oithona nana genome sequencing.
MHMTYLILLYFFDGHGIHKSLEIKRAALLAFLPFQK